MACSCGSGSDAEQWEVVYADNTVSNPTTKAEATLKSNQAGGSWIRKATTASVSA